MKATARKKQPPAPTPDPYYSERIPFKEAPSVLITRSDFNKLVERYDKDTVLRAADILHAYKIGTGKTYTNDNYPLTQWAIEAALKELKQEAKNKRLFDEVRTIDQQRQRLEAWEHELQALDARLANDFMQFTEYIKQEKSALSLAFLNPENTPLCAN